MNFGNKPKIMEIIFVLQAILVRFVIAVIIMGIIGKVPI